MKTKPVPANKRQNAKNTEIKSENTRELQTTLVGSCVLYMCIESVPPGAKVDKKAEGSNN